MNRLLLAMVSFCSIAFFLSAGSLFAEKPVVLFEDDFERTELGKQWDVHPNSFRIEDGTLIAAQRKDASHGAVSQVFVDFKDATLSFRFRIEGTTQGFNIVIDDRKYKQSHAGHICRVVIRDKYILLGDDKTGAMKNDLFEMVRNPKTKQKANELLKGKSLRVPFDLKRDTWHTILVKISGDRIGVLLDKKEIGIFQSEGIAHPTKTDFGFTIIGQSVRFDDVRLQVP